MFLVSVVVFVDDRYEPVMSLSGRKLFVCALSRSERGATLGWRGLIMAPGSIALTVRSTVFTQARDGGDGGGATRFRAQYTLNVLYRHLVCTIYIVWGGKGGEPGGIGRIHSFKTYNLAGVRAGG